MKKVFIYFFYLLLLTAADVALQSAEPIESERDLPEPAPLLRERDFIQQRAFPLSDIPDGARSRAFKQLESMYAKNTRSMLLAQQPQWRPIGPYDVGGRIKTIAPHPAKEGWVYVGAAAGGIWLTKDGGENWEPIFDYENAIAFGSISIDKNNPDIIYAGTGEAVQGGNSYLGSGMYKTTDGGKNWKLIGLSQVGAFSKVYVHPMSSRIVVAGAIKRGQGFWVSADSGATWKKMHEGAVTDVSINPNDPAEYFIAISGDGIYHTTDGALNWTKADIDVSGAPLGRISVQQAPSDPKYVYALAEVVMNGTNVGMLFRSDNRGQAFSLTYNGGNSFFNNQGFYDNYIVVHPTNPNLVIAGGIDMWRTSNGMSWDNVTNGYAGGNVHVDQHVAAFNPLDPNVVYAGNDGGMYKSYDAGYSWTEINHNLQVTQFYAMDIDESQKNINYGGTQDNGTVGNNESDQWRGIFGGDGFRVFADKDKPSIVYGELYYGSMMRRDLSTGDGPVSIVSGIKSDDAQGLWNSPFIMDHNYNDIFYHGRKYLYASYYKGQGWVALTKQPYGGLFSAIDPSRADPNIVWAGNQVGEVIVSEDAETWNLVSGNGLISRYVTDIETSYKDRATAYVTYSGFGTPHVFKTTDLGAHWTNISKGLPDVPCNALTINPDNENMMFVATDIGVFATFDGGISWMPYGRGLPRSPVLDIEIHTNKLVMPDMVLRVATHGRSMWEVDMPKEAPSDPAIVTPAGGELVFTGTSMPIRWYGFQEPVKLEFSSDDGATWNSITDNATGSFINWNIPQRPTFAARVRVTSVAQPEQSLVSRTFTILLKEKGTILTTAGVSYIPYGVAYDGNNGLWTTSFESNQLLKLNSETLVAEKALTLPGDSLYTDLTYDPAKGWLYVHRMFSTVGGGGEIMVVDTNGTMIKRMPSAAINYPIGIEMVDGSLVVTERDSPRMIRQVDPETGKEFSSVKNPYQKTYGPRGLCYDGSQYLYQVCTDFPGGGSLTSALLIKIDKDNLGNEVDEMPLESLDGLINARGCTYDPRDKNFWISEYYGSGGTIYKIAGFETVTSVDDSRFNMPGYKPGETINANIFPNPLTEYSTVSFSLPGGPGEVTVNIFNTLGQNLGTFFDKSMSKDEVNYVQINKGQLAPGVYTVVFTVGGRQAASRQLVVIN